MTRQPTLFDDKRSIEERFADFDREHPEVYRHFKRIARELREKGYGHYSADGICHVIRYHRATTGADSRGWKLNNDFTALFARKLIAEDESFGSFFRTRERKSAS